MWTICTDVKLPSVCFVLLLLVQQDFLTMYAGGGSRCDSESTCANEDGSGFPGDINGLISPFDVPANNVYFNFRNGKRLNPRTSTPSKCQISMFCTVVAIWNPMVIYNWFSCISQNLLQSKDVESIPRTELHDGSTIFSCQTLLDCLCTFDAFHISNSIRYF